MTERKQSHFSWWKEQLELEFLRDTNPAPLLLSVFRCFLLEYSACPLDSSCPDLKVEFDTEGKRDC